MRTAADIMALWPSVSEFARDIGVKPSHAQTMKVRGSIPSRYWERVVYAGKVRRLGISFETLAMLSKPKSRSAA